MMMIVMNIILYWRSPESEDYVELNINRGFS